jgi:hypothetical protein
MTAMSVPPGWSIGPDGQPIPPTGGVPVGGSPVLYGAGSVELPLVSMGLGAAIGYVFGKRQGNGTSGALAGAMVGFFWHPLG